MQEERQSFASVHPPMTKGMEILERAMHEIDIEVSGYLATLPIELIRRLAQVERCYSILFIAITRHLSEHVREQIPQPDPAVARILEMLLKEME